MLITFSNEQYRKVQRKKSNKSSQNQLPRTNQLTFVDRNWMYHYECEMDLEMES